mgnify:CR=1 FL=1
MATMQELKESLEEIVENDVETVEEEGIELDIMTLDQHPGWKALVKELKREKEGLEAEIFDINSGLSDEEVKEKRIKRYYINYLINLPKTKSELFKSRKLPEEEDI